MRLAVCALSAVLLSGCSWLGMGGGSSHSGASGAYGACAPQACAGGAGGYGLAGNGYGAGYGAQGAGYGAQGYGAQGYGQGAGYGAQGAGYGASGAYGAGAGQYAAVGGAGYGAGAGAGYGAGGLNGYGAGAGVGYQGAYGVPGQVGMVGGRLNGPTNGLGAFGNGSVTTLGGAAPYGAAVGGVYGQNVVASQYANGQVVQGATQTLVGSPIYVPQPYGVPYGVGGGATAVGAALPFGLALLGGTDFDLSGDIYTDGKNGPAKNADGTDSTTVNVSDSNGISYSDAFGQSKRVGVALERDLNRSTTLLGQVGYSQANGQTAENYETVTDGSFDAAGVFTPVGAPRSLNASFSDLETYSVEAGLRKYVGANPAFRPYVGATGGVVYNNGVDVNRTFADDGTAYDGAPLEFIDSGFQPTAAGLIGAEMAVGHRGSIGIESGVRWTNGVDTLLGDADSRISVPVNLRGRVAF